MRQSTAKKLSGPRVKLSTDDLMLITLADRERERCRLKLAESAEAKAFLAANEAVQSVCESLAKKYGVAIPIVVGDDGVLATVEAESP